MPLSGFLFPAYAEQCVILSHIDFFEGKNGGKTEKGMSYRKILDNTLAEMSIEM